MFEPRLAFGCSARFSRAAFTLEHAPKSLLASRRRAHGDLERTRFEGRDQDQIMRPISGRL